MRNPKGAFFYERRANVKQSRPRLTPGSADIKFTYELRSALFHLHSDRWDMMDDRVRIVRTFTLP